MPAQYQGVPGTDWHWAGFFCSDRRLGHSTHKSLIQFPSPAVLTELEKCLQWLHESFPSSSSQWLFIVKNCGEISHYSNKQNRHLNGTLGVGTGMWSCTVSLLEVVCFFKENCLQLMGLMGNNLQRINVIFIQQHCLGTRAWSCCEGLLFFSLPVFSPDGHPFLLGKNPGVT